MIYNLSLDFSGDVMRVFSDGKMVDVIINSAGGGEAAGLHLTKEEFYKLIRAFMFLDNETDKEEDDE